MKHSMKMVVATMLLCTSITAEMIAQGTLADYQRAYSLSQEFNSNRVLHQMNNLKWTARDTFTYITHTTAGDVYRVGSIGADGICNVYDGVKPAPAPAPHNNYPKRHWMEVDDEKGNRPVLSPDGKRKAFIKNDNVYVSDVDGKNEHALSDDGTQGNYYSSWISWSPDGRYVAANRIRPAEKRYVYYVESRPGWQEQPVLHKQEYAKPGDELMWKRPAIFEVNTGKKMLADTRLFEKQYALRGPVWNADSKAITFEYNERGHQVFRVLEMSAENGNVRTLVEETSDTFVNYNRYFRLTLKSGKEMIWMSERDNWCHLYLYDIEKGKMRRQITKGNWVVREVQRVDEEQGVIYFSASGMDMDEDPYFVHYYRIGIDGKNLTCLTPEKANHNASYNDDFSYLIDTYSTVNEAPVSVIRSVADGKVQTLETADITAIKEKGWIAPEVFVAPGRDGKTPIWGIIQRPTNFDPTKKYPIIEYIYAGPGSAYTPKSFSSFNWNMTPLAELGFIVVQMDGMGTDFRGREFENVCYKNLKDAGFPDRIAWIKAAAQKYAYMDTTRVGIFGASAGGQESTAALLWHGDFYKAAYSSCGCHDNRMDKIWWNEQWMGYPVDSSYVASSNVANAHLLQRPLMLVVGELDDNVDPASTMQLAAELIKANKDFELVVLPGVHHTMGERFGEHKRFDFFVKYLLGVTPPAWSELEKKQ